MKKSNLRLLAFSLFLVLVQNSLANKIEDGNGSVASDESVAIGISWLDYYGVVHKNIAGDETKPTENYYATAIGIANKVSGKYSSAFGFRNEVSGEDSSAFGHWNRAKGINSSAFGFTNEASGAYSSAFGSRYKVTGEASGTFGVGKATFNFTTHEWEYGYINEGKDSYMFGNYNKIAADTENNFILGNNVSIGSDINNSVALGNNSTVSSSNEVSVGNATQKRKITNVADGEISATSTDSVTGKQLYSGDGIDTNAWKTKLGVTSGGVDLTAYTKRDGSNLTASDISTWKTKLGVGSGGSGMANSATGTGSTGLGVDNTVTGDYSTAVGYKNKVTGNHSGAFGDPNIVTGNGSYAFGNDNNIAGDNNFVLGNNVNIGAGIQNSVALGNNSTVSSSNEVSVGSATQQRKITNVADGEVSATSTDAVNGRQLYKAMQNSNENLRNEVNEKIDDVKNEVRGVGSLSAALAGLHPMQYDPKAPAQVMAALGNYKNKQSVAVGLSYYFNDRFMMSAGIAIGSERRVKSMANVGFTVKLGKGSRVTYNETPQYTVQNEVKRLTVENQELKAKVDSQDKKIKNLEEKLDMLLKNK
ncbi:YadA-like family protein [Fusobacterium nucleatum]|uniref:YadA-like family protein n=1 Tax=Fusobacterium nucleatum TaxID=851 RepID=UPI0004257B0C|nr:YadA family autotransporter adhesin [Fusobacterium nucleatum]